MWSARWSEFGWKLSSCASLIVAVIVESNEQALVVWQQPNSLTKFRLRNERHRYRVSVDASGIVPYREIVD